MSFAVALPVMAGSASVSGIPSMLLTAGGVIGVIGHVTGDDELVRLGQLGALIGGGMMLGSSLAGGTSIAGEASSGVGTGAGTGVIGTGAGTAATGLGSEAAAKKVATASLSLPERAAGAVTGEVSGPISGLVDVPKVELTSNFGKNFARQAVVNNRAVPSVIAGSAPPASDSFMGMIGKAIKDNPAAALYAGSTLAQVGGSALSGAFAAGTEEEKLALARERFDKEQELAAQRQANFNNIGQVNIPMRPIISANLYPNQPNQYGYRTPVIPTAV
jgi:hypothetical protein